MKQEYNLKLIIPPKVEPLTLEQVKLYLKIDDLVDPDEDLYVQSLITVAREWCEAYQHRAYITQTWEMSLNEFPCVSDDMLNDYETDAIIEIPKGNLQKINSITYKDLYGTEHTLVENDDYIVSIRGILGKVCPPYGKIFPCMPLWPLDPIIINFTCGYGDDSTKMPAKIIQAMYLLISHWYDNRSIVSDLRGVDPTKEMAFAVTSLLSVNKISMI